MKIFGISDAIGFFEKIQHCAGGVYSFDENGEKRDMKRMAEYLTWSGMLKNISKIPEVDIVLEDASDFKMMLGYVFSLGHAA